MSGMSRPGPLLLAIVFFAGVIAGNVLQFFVLVPGLRQKIVSKRSNLTTLTAMPTPSQPAAHLDHCDAFSHHVANMDPRANLENFCPCCGFRGDKHNFTSFNGRMHAMCPSCHAMERHRAACLNLARFSLLKPGSGKVKRILHFGPHPSMYEGIEATCAHARLDHIPVDFFAKGYRYHASTLHADVSSLRFPDDFVDVILIFHVLEHVRNLEDAYLELYRVLKYGGRMLVEVPCGVSLENHKDCRHWYDEASLKECAGQRDHVWRFSCKMFAEQLRDAGFHCEKTKSLHMPQFMCTKQGNSSVSNFD
jgi:hypothetical protein